MTFTSGDIKAINHDGLHHWRGDNFVTSKVSSGLLNGSAAAVVPAGGFGFFPEKDAIDKNRQRDADDCYGGVSLPMHLIKSPSVSRFGRRARRRHMQSPT